MKLLPALVATLCFSLTVQSVRAAEDWRLAWSDEFDYEGPPDPNKWGYEEGFVRNHEAQFYTVGRRENARVENGMLTIEARKEHWDNPGGRSAEYTSASLNTLHKKNALFGRLEMRAKLPSGKGVWPAFWTLGENIGTAGWPRCGEIDVMEFVGHDPRIIYGTLHWGANQHSGNHTAIEHLADAFHVFAANWSPERIEFFVDDKKYHSMELGAAEGGGGNAFRQPQYLLLNLAMGGDWGGPIDDAVMPQRLQVDYVRVFEKK